MDIVSGLALLVSLLLGILLALIIDGRILGRQLQTAVSGNRELQEKLRALAVTLRRPQQKLQASQAQVRGANQ